MKQQNVGKDQIESKNKIKVIKSHHVDSIEMSQLNDAIQSYVESDKHDKEEGSNKTQKRKNQNMIKNV